MVSSESTGVGHKGSHRGSSCFAARIPARIRRASFSAHVAFNWCARLVGKLRSVAVLVAEVPLAYHPIAAGLAFRPERLQGEQREMSRTVFTKYLLLRISMHSGQAEAKARQNGGLI